MKWTSVSQEKSNIFQMPGKVDQVENINANIIYWQIEFVCPCSRNAQMIISFKMEIQLTEICSIHQSKVTLYFIGKAKVSI